MTPLYAAAIRYADAAIAADEAFAKMSRDQDTAAGVAYGIASEAEDEARAVLCEAALNAAAERPPEARAAFAIDTPGGSDSQIGEDH